MSVLHPRHKLAYFKEAGWELEWIDRVEGIVCAEFECSYMPGRDDAEDNEIATPAVLEVLCLTILSVCGQLPN